MPKRHGHAQLMEAQHIVRFVRQTDTGKIQRVKDLKRIDIASKRAMPSGIYRVLKVKCLLLNLKTVTMLVMKRS